jgi:2-polyprenyl-3-methyl-5-hydroxy-6-metoxy-1,4-benzoquinol methylase
VNRLWDRRRRPERGWDPVSAEYAAAYADEVYRTTGPALVDQTEALYGDLAGHTVLDLAAGPGQSALEFARRGAKVTWYDASRNYRTIAKRRAADEGLALDFQIGHLDEFEGRYDVIFCSLAWYYCRDDTAFARRLISSLEPGGLLYCRINNGDYLREAVRSLPASRRYLVLGQFELYARTGIKLGHPQCDTGRVAKALADAGATDLRLHSERGTTLISARP